MDKALNYLALARKGGMAELGEEPVGAAARAGKAHLILVAGDASDHTWRRAKSFAAGTDQQCIRMGCTKDEMGLVIGRTSLAIAAITDALKAEDKVQIVGFGSFEVKKKAAHMGRNPRTGETMKIAASKNPTFKAGKALKDAVAE